MCGIIGFSLQKADNPISVLIQHLSYLEYRGYDSTGIAFVDTDRHMHVFKKVGNISALKELTHALPAFKACYGMGHTRWATHGEPSDQNAHPHTSNDVVIVHNGIIENYQTIKEHLRAKGYEFQSDTDSEMIAHYISDGIAQGLSHEQIFQNFYTDFHGTFAVVALFHDGSMIATRLKSPLVFCQAHNGIWIASDALAIANHSKDGSVCFMKDGDILSIDPDHSYRFFNCLADEQHEDDCPYFTKIDRRYEIPSKENFDHFMLKEIYEQPEIAKGLYQFLKHYNFHLSTPQKILILGCGTSYYTGLIASYWLQEHAGIETDVCIASEFRYQSFMRSYDLCICISQSGETIDVIGALELVKARGIKTLGILNVIESSLGQMVDMVLPIGAGPEIGVASTKASTAQLICLLFLALRFSRNEEWASVIKEIPALLQAALSQASALKKLCTNYQGISSAFFIGRQQMFPVGLEGALKLKEISYINANAYPAGELKHGPIALIDEHTLTIACLTDDHVFDKTISNVLEITSRQGQVLLITKKDTGLAPQIMVPQCSPFLTPFAPFVIMQLFAYYMALQNNCSIDQPRNLAKSVTVE